jgi:hypothetical protein
VSIADSAAKVENDRQECVMKLLQAHDVSVKTVHATLHRICRFQEVGQLSNQTALLGDEGVIQNVSGNHSDDHRGFLTISDNVLIVGGSVGGKKQASRQQPQSGGLPVGAGGGKKNGTAVNFAKAQLQ